MKCRLKYLEACLNASIEVAKEKHYHNTINKLANVQKSFKVYWLLLKPFLNNKKLHIIPSLFHEIHFKTDFLKKAKLFNFSISKPSYLILSNSSIPVDVNYINDMRLVAVTFSTKEFGKIIKILNSKKFHGHCNISIHMLKRLEDSICVPLEMIFKNILLTGVFPLEWKKAVLISKKSDKQNIKNYRLVSLLPICGRVCEILISNERYNYFSANIAISKNQFGFQDGDSYDIFKTFDKVWQ